MSDCSPLDAWKAVTMDEAYRSFAFIAACLTVLHFILPLVISSPSCSGSIAVIAPSASLVCLGTVYALGFLIWIRTTTFDSFFTYSLHGDGVAKQRSSRQRSAEDIRFMTFLWMAFGASGLLSNDLTWAARFLYQNARSTDRAQTMWTLWIALFALVATLAALSLSHLLAMGAEAGIEAAEGMLRRVNKVRTKAIKLS